MMFVTVPKFTVCQFNVSALSIGVGGETSIPEVFHEMHQIQFQEKSIMLTLAFKLFLNLRLYIDSFWASVATICS